MIRAMGLDMVSSEPLTVPDADDPVRALIDQHLGPIWRVLLRFGVPRADLPDAAQQVFTVAARRLGRLRPGSERAFLYQTAIRVAADVRRTNRRRRENDDAALDERVDDRPSPDELLDRARARAVLDGVLEDLPMEMRAVFVLFELEEMPMIEIAALLDLPAGTVASRLRRGRELFRRAAKRIRARGAKS
jgi:RNA polymerase sigma-70 factor (ECF subfamily)